MKNDRTIQYEADLKQMIEDDVISNADFEFDEIELINNRPMNVWLTAKCLKYIDPDDEDPEIEADVQTNERYTFQHETDDEW